MYKLKTVENMVLNVLISNPDARDDDMRLYYYVCRDCISETHGNTHLSFEEVMTNYKELGCPGFESVRRTRQKIQAILPNSAARLLSAEEETKALSHTRTTP